MKFVPRISICLDLIPVRGPLLGLAAAEDRERGGRAHEAQPRVVPGEDGADGGAAQEDARGTLMPKRLRDSRNLYVRTCLCIECAKLQTVFFGNDANRLTTVQVQVSGGIP